MEGSLFVRPISLFYPHVNYKINLDLVFKQETKPCKLQETLNISATTQAVLKFAEVDNAKSPNRPLHTLIMRLLLGGSQEVGFFCVSQCRGLFHTYLCTLIIIQNFA